MMRDAPMQLGLETFSYLPMFACGRMDVFRFIERTHALGLDGVQINICSEREHWGMLGGIEPDRLREARRLTESLGMYVEVATYGMDYEHLRAALRVSHALGADVLRTYASTPEVLEGPALRDYMRPGGGLQRRRPGAHPILCRRASPVCCGASPGARSLDITWASGRAHSTLEGPVTPPARRPSTRGGPPAFGLCTP